MPPSRAVTQAIDLGLAHHQAGRFADAESAYMQALQADPRNTDALHLLGVIASQAGKYETAIELIDRALALKPDFAEALSNRGNALQELRRYAEAVASYDRALSIKPGIAVALSNRGNALKALGRLDEALASFDQALALRPDYAEALFNRGTALEELAQLDAAVAAYERAIAARPDYAEAYCNRGNALTALGKPEAAVASYRKALALRPDYAEAHSNLLLALNYVSGLPPAEIYAAHRAFARWAARDVAPGPHGNAPDPERRLRVGYVSGDFRAHAVAQFIEPVLALHDRARYEVFCYYNFPSGDAATARIRGHADRWHEVFALSDQALAQLVRADAIDILVDLSGHTGYNRLRVFACKPAPVQITWLGYLNTTGLDSMDYRISDGQASPPSLLDAFHSEKLLRLPHSQWHYQPPPDAPDVAPPPRAQTGVVTFAAFTNLAKIGPTVIELWCRLLARVAGSRLFIVGRGAGAMRDEYVARFTRHGARPDQIELGDLASFQNYLALHHQADIMLDTFPYSGGTTTCHALWMGVPVITLAGDTAPSRGGASLLNAVGLAEFVAQTPQRYLEIASALALDPPRLAALRAGMRARMAASPLMDSQGFTRDLEQAYRSAWRAWCGRPRAPEPAR